MVHWCRIILKSVKIMNVEKACYILGLCEILHGARQSSSSKVAPPIFPPPVKKSWLRMADNVGKNISRNGSIQLNIELWPKRVAPTSEHHVVQANTSYKRYRIILLCLIITLITK